MQVLQEQKPVVYLTYIRVDHEVIGYYECKILVRDVTIQL